MFTAILRIQQHDTTLKSDKHCDTKLGIPVHDGEPTTFSGQQSHTKEVVLYVSLTPSTTQAFTAIANKEFPRRSERVPLPSAHSGCKLAQ